MDYFLELEILRRKREGTFPEGIDDVLPLAKLSTYFRNVKRRGPSALELGASATPDELKSWALQRTRDKLGGDSIGPHVPYVGHSEFNFTGMRA
jgi:hypothetical protein